jgi:serine/threonine protein kinase
MKDGHTVLEPDLGLCLVVFALGYLAFAQKKVTVQLVDFLAQKKDGSAAFILCGVAAIVWCMPGSGNIRIRTPLEAIHVLSGMEDSFLLLAGVSLAAYAVSQTGAQRTFTLSAASVFGGLVALGRSTSIMEAAAVGCALVGSKLLSNFVNVHIPVVIVGWTCWLQGTWWTDADKDGDKDMDDLFKTADKNGDGFLDMVEVARLVLPPAIVLMVAIFDHRHSHIQIAQLNERVKNQDHKLETQVQKIETQDQKIETQDQKIGKLITDNNTLKHDYNQLEVKLVVDKFMLTQKAKKQQEALEKAQKERERFKLLHEQAVTQASGRDVPYSKFSDIKKKDHPHCILQSEIEFGKKLGEGGFGEVRLGKWNGQDVAIKMIKRERMAMAEREGAGEETRQDFLNEIALLKDARHPNVVLLLGWNATTEGDFMFVTEVMYRGSLSDCIEGDVEKNSGEFKWSANGKKLAEDILKGLTFLHECKPPRCHLDLKTENILISSDLTAKIGDLGLTRKGEGEGGVMHQNSGYHPPEIMNFESWGPKSDMYAVAMTMLAIHEQKEPREMERTVFLDENYDPLPLTEANVAFAIQQQRQGDKDEWSDEVSKWVSHGQKTRNYCNADAFEDKAVLRFIDECLKGDPVDRPTAKQFLESGVLSQKGGGLDDGDIVTITKRGSQHGNHCKITGRFWCADRIKVEMIDGPCKGQTKSYHLYDLGDKVKAKYPGLAALEAALAADKAEEAVALLLRMVE